MDDFQALGRDIQEAARALHGQVRAAVFKGAIETKRAAIPLAPRFLGVPQIAFEVTENDGADEIAAVVETSGVGGAIAEFGSPTMPGGRPFMGPAFRDQVEATERAVDLILKDLLW